MDNKLTFQPMHLVRNSKKRWKATLCPICEADRHRSCGHHSSGHPPRLCDLALEGAGGRQGWGHVLQHCCDSQRKGLSHTLNQVVREHGLVLSKRGLKMSKAGLGPALTGWKIVVLWERSFLYRSRRPQLLDMGMCPKIRVFSFPPHLKRVHTKANTLTHTKSHSRLCVGGAPL